MNPQADIDGKHYPDNAEPLGAVIDRVYACVSECRAGDNCLFVCHGIPFRAISRKFLGEMYSSPNAAPVRFENSGGRWRMIALDPENAPIPQVHNATHQHGPDLGCVKLVSDCPHPDNTLKNNKILSYKLRPRFTPSDYGPLKSSVV